MLKCMQDGRTSSGQPTSESLGGRVALITGGSSAIGAEIARALGRSGARVVLTYNRGADAAETVLAELAAEGVVGSVVQCDIASSPEVAVEHAVRAFGRLDIVVSNAGIPSSESPVSETAQPLVELSMAVHAIGPHQLVRAALPYLRRHERSDIVIVSSAATTTFRPGAAIYAMGKAAQEALAHTVAREERANGVHVNIVAPGMVDAGMGRRALSRLGDVGDDLAAHAPFGRLCRASDVAQVIEFLVSEGGDYVNDQRIVVDGGSFDLPWSGRGAQNAASADRAQ